MTGQAYEAPAPGGRQHPPSETDLRNIYPSGASNAVRTGTVLLSHAPVFTATLRR